MSKTLLLADDSVVIQKLVGLSFANEDVELVSTDNGDDAVLKAREIRPDVVLADVVMPGKSGYEVCEAIKKDPTLAHVPVLLLTGTFEAFDESRAASVGADGHITKPFEAQALVERVKNVIKNAARPAAPPAATRASASVGSLFQEAGDDRVDDESMLAPPVAQAAGRGDDFSATEDGFLGLGDSLDVTPSLSESDLSDGLDGDLFGPPGEIGGPSFGTNVAPSRAGESTPRFDPAPAVAESSFVQAPVEDATVAILPGSAVDPTPALPEDFGFDEPLELAPMPVSALDLDSAFDPEPPAAAKIQVVRDDANAMTSRSLGQAAGVTDLDELLAAPVPPSARIERRPEPPIALDFGPTEQSAGDLDFGFDVSEQAPIAKVDLLEESFSSLLDVSESQLLADPTPAGMLATTSAPAATSARAPLAPEPIALDAFAEEATEFDVSSSDLATSSPLFDEPATLPPIPAPASAAPLEPLAPMASAATSAPLLPPPIPAVAPSGIASGISSNTSATASLDGSWETPPPLPPRARKPELDLDLFLDEPRPPSEPARSTPAAPANVVAASASERRAVDDLSPILQQRVHETLEKVAWEAFSDLSETIVKQVIERVERIAWDVIPQMAETLVREEIRKLKGEGD